jgi:uncharacterized protein (TIGR02444 family)
LLGERLSQPDARDCGSGKLQYDNDFWRFSLVVYGQDAVAEQCLGLQVAIGVDVNLLLFCAWTGARSIVLSSADIEGASSSVAAWQDHVVRPLRNVRQHIKTLEGSEYESVRAQVKSLEIEAERIEQAILFAYWKGIQSSRTGTDGRSAISQNLKKYIEIKSGAKPPVSFEVSVPHLIEAAIRIISAP